MSLDGERSPKRQRLDDSYSPASPPISADTKAFIPPQTPPPSVRMSPSWQPQSQSQPQTSHHPQSGSNSTFPTPPSTAGFHSHLAGRGAGSDTGADSGRQTPASEGENEMRRDGDGDAEMADSQTEGAGQLSMTQLDHRRSNHERDGINAASVPGVQPLYKLSTAPIAPSKPHPTQDFVQLYSLERIQRSVARRDPATGEKINKLRKSYENKVKALELEGRNKAQPNQGELQGLLDPLWDSVFDGGSATMWEGKWAGENEMKNLANPAAHQDLFSKLETAFTMRPGRLPPAEHKEWQNSLGLDDSVIAAGARTPSGVAKPTATGLSAIVKTGPAAAARSSAPASPRNGGVRPGRAGSKRRYDDSSFEGYTGYEEDGYSTGGIDDASRRGSGAKRQKRKVSYKAPGFYDLQNEETLF